MLARDGPECEWAAVVLLKDGRQERYPLDACTPEEAGRAYDEFVKWRKQMADPNYIRPDERCWCNPQFYACEG